MALATLTHMGRAAIAKAISLRPLHLAWGTGALVLDGTTQQGDGLVEYRFRSELSNVNQIKIRLSLTGTSAARPQVRNIRLMAVV